ncbi:hypothetical protein [Sulfuricurvum sp.]|uniref:hypothetical protein n=1 Tax=Sulfuricurvum sp. TaxID=2025608 RepID=UPI0019B9ABDF|nr:hypothetical protein [Sulfuricurvum sp.]MBD3799282.1 hypothetical protein [Campylobacterota bacterium]MBD3806010.1 hypothetical protein [Sulfuricurvum sp.]
MQTCAELGHGEILNASHPQWPLIEGILYGDATLSLKLAKRLVCGVKHLPLRLKLSIITDTRSAIEAGVTHDPTLFVNGKPFIKGLVAAETLTAAFEQYLKESL